VGSRPGSPRLQRWVPRLTDATKERRLPLVQQKAIAGQYRARLIVPSKNSRRPSKVEGMPVREPSQSSCASAPMMCTSVASQLLMGERERVRRLPAPVT
jgi:hypothetical protein